MTTISPAQVKRDNSDVYRCDDRGIILDRALRSERGKNPDLTQSYQLFTSLLPRDEDPYPGIDFRMDVEAFSESLEGDYRTIFSLFMQECSPKDITTMTGIPVKTVYRKLEKLRGQFKQFYGED